MHVTIRHRYNKDYKFVIRVYKQIKETKWGSPHEENDCLEIHVQNKKKVDMNNDRMMGDPSHGKITPRNACNLQVNKADYKIKIRKSGNNITPFRVIKNIAQGVKDFFFLVYIYIYIYHWLKIRNERQ